MRLRLLSICLLTLALSAAPALAEHDMVQFGSNIRVAQGQTIHDAVCFFCGVDDKGTIEGDVVVFFGSVHIAGNAHHDVVSFFGNISVDDNASIEHDMVNFFGNIRLGHNVTIGKDMGKEVEILNGIQGSEALVSSPSDLLNEGEHIDVR